MSITIRNIKLLWSRSAGRCSAPDCRKDLTPNINRSGNFILGEMAHVIGRRPGSARNDPNVSADNSYDNLILLCKDCHTKIDTPSADYPPEMLLKWKTDWESEVNKKLLPDISTTIDSSLDSRMWTFFNFNMLLGMYNTHCKERLLSGSIDDLRYKEIIDNRGLPKTGPISPTQARTLFETWDQNTGWRLQSHFSCMTEELLRFFPPLDIDRVWGIRLMRAHLFPSAFVFMNRRCYFKSSGVNSGGRYRDVRARAGGIEIRFQIDTWNIYSNSSLTLHFAGATRIASLLWIRSVEKPVNEKNLKLVVTATPIALGSGFHPSEDRTPDIAHQRAWAEDEDNC